MALMACRTAAREGAPWCRAMAANMAICAPLSGRADRIKRAQQWVQVMLYRPLSGCCFEYSQEVHGFFVLSVVMAKAFWLG